MKFLNHRAVRGQRGINMVDLMMWLVIAALLLAAAIQGIGYYQQAAYAYSAKEDVMSIQKWAAANSATTSKVPTADEIKTALTNGDLKLTSDHSALVASVGAKYCVGVFAPPINNTNKVFYSTSDSPSDIKRAAAMPTTCGTAANSGSNGGVGAGGTAGTGSTVTSTPLPVVSTARLKFGISEPNGPLSTQVDDVARLVNEYPGLVATYKDWGTAGNSAFNKAEVDAVINKGSQPMITWEPFIAADGVTQPNYELRDIYNGNHDAYIKTWTDAIAATSYDKPILIRFAHEMNGNWYPWAENLTGGANGTSVNGNANGDYIKAWRYVHDKFTAAGIQSKVDFVWAPNIPYTGGTEFWKIYPGDAYVDIVGIDGFNYGTTESWSTWKAPWDVLGGGLWHARDVPNNKPIIITETGSAPTEGTNSQGQWAANLVSWLNDSHPTDPARNDNADIIGFVWFDQIKADQLETGGGVKNWRLDSTPETSQKMKDALAARR